ncbi:MAG: DUF2461 domain-containing protein [Acidobacteriia bacterium]|nr:DUF2461 domain-containing protein [Terriglobia bacterium]
MERRFPGFPQETLRFLRQLSRNNNREWFQAHRELYEEKVKAPMIGLVLALGGALQVFAPELVADPRRAIFRIYRDTRFTQDKSPYKTQIAAVFVPRGIPKHRGAALYFHISPEEVLIAGGIYMPAPVDLRAIRRHIAVHSDEIRKIISNREFKKIFGRLEGEQLTRAPREFPPDHPAIDLLRYKQYLVSITHPPQFAEDPRLFSRILTSFTAMMPLVRFLNIPLKADTASLSPDSR